MDHKKSYEQTITSKLDALPLPDMANAIWSRIETQLDINMPGDDVDGNQPGSPSGGIWQGTAGLFLFIAAFIMVFLQYKNNKKPELLLQPEKPAPRAQPPTLNEIRNSVPFRKRETKPQLPATRSVAAPDKSSNGRTTSIAAPALMPSDSAWQTTAAPPPPLPGTDAAQPPKKTRGITGITDDDYRIAPVRKDSM